MVKFRKNKLAVPVKEKISDAMLGTGEHMCTCAALVADIIIEQGQENASLKELMKKVEAGEPGSESATGKVP